MLFCARVRWTLFEDLQARLRAKGKSIMHSIPWTRMKDLLSAANDIEVLNVQVERERLGKIEESPKI